MKLTIFILFILVFSQNSFAKPRSGQKNKPVVSFKSSEVKEVLKKNLSKRLCRNRGPIRSCSRVSKNKCQRIVQKNLIGCLKKTKVKRSLSSIDSVKYAEKVGLCIRPKNKHALYPFRKVCKKNRKRARR